LEQSQHPASIDYYYAAISASWLALTAASPAAGAPPPLDPQAWAIYHDSLARLILAGQRHGRLDPRRGLTVNTASGQILIPTRYFGFSWKPEDFHQLLVVSDYRTKRPRHVYRRPGLGVPLVVMRYQNGGGFFREQHPFPATAILRPAVGVAQAPGSPSLAVGADAGPSLDFCDSLMVRQVPWAGMQLDLAADITAPFALVASQAEQIKIRDLLLPGSSTNPAQLYFVEPYRPGKIPVVFVHGLLSEPSTWLDPVNDLRALPQVMERFQLWGFRYPTATSLLGSAAVLREQLQLAVATVDPGGTDPALRQMVLVGHSMGGLVSKLQVTSSGSAIWSRVANRPLETIVADEQIKARLRRDTFFEPSPFVRRVIFVGTPHGGSSIASNLIGRLASWYIEPSTEATQIHQLLIQYNPNTFSPDVQDGFPNSVDLLEPTSPLLAALQQMPIHPQVRLHSIIGRGYPMLTAGDSDGVVPVSSARHPGVQTETLVQAWHTEIHSHPEALQTLLGILSMHYADYQTPLGQ